VIPLEKVGLYVPGGTAAYPSTVLMDSIPAKIAGVEEIVMVTPPNKEGSVNPYILAAAHVAGVGRIFKIGGAQAVAALAYGTGSIPRVDKIVGPGNAFVAEAKKQVFGQVGIDMIAGPSEVLVLADGKSDPRFVAADLLSQAEHGRDSQVLLVTTSANLIEKVEPEVEQQLARLPRRDIAADALKASKIILAKDDDEMMRITNLYAPEHHIIETRNYMELASRVKNAGSVFLGSLTPESAGDYASGTNHTLPTNGYARAYNGVNLDSFLRKITFQHITPQGIRAIGPAVERMAAGEELEGHRNAMSLRLGQL
jgi:histidinol dehydrogenase